jgi:TRAP-type C4-dicarboxylate transport system substrate-binding protein
MPVTDVYLAIQQGTVDGQENPVDTILSLKFTEVAPNLTLTRHVYSPLPLTVAEKTWQSFSDVDKDAITRAAADSSAFSRELVKSSEAAQLEQMAAEGATIITPDVGPFRDAVASVYDQARGVYGTEVDKVLAEVETIRTAMPAQ